MLFTQRPVVVIVFTAPGEDRNKIIALRKTNAGQDECRTTPTEDHSKNFKRRLTNQIIKKAKRGFRGYPVATVAYYGPDNKKATKVAVGIIRYEDAEADPLVRWHGTGIDVRLDENITRQILDFMKEHNVVSVASTSRLLGCPHEEGTDYPEGETCPKCPYWIGKDRRAGAIEELTKG